MSDFIQFILPLNKRKFIGLEHNESCDNFVILVNYDKTQFGDRIPQFMQDIIKKSQKSDFYRYHWAVHRPLMEDKLNVLLSFSKLCTNIFTVN